MVGVDVHVEQPRGRGERRAQRLDHVLVAALGEVRHGLQHAPYSRRMKAYYEARAPEYDDWWLGPAASTGASGPAGRRARTR